MTNSSATLRQKVVLTLLTKSSANFIDKKVVLTLVTKSIVNFSVLSDLPFPLISWEIWTDLHLKGLKIKDDSDNVTGQQAVYTICHYRMGGNLRRQKNPKMPVHLFYSAFWRTKTELSLTQIFPSNIGMKA